MKKKALFNYIKTVLAFVLGSLCFTYSTAQDIGHGNIPDSLVQKSYQELRDIYYPLMEGTDTINTTFFINAHIKKAKLEKDTLEQAAAYYNVAFSMNSQDVLRYSDSIIDITKDIRDYKYPSYGFLRKAVIQFNQGKYTKSLDNLLLAAKMADTTNIELIWSIKEGISNLKSRAERYEEAINIRLEILNSVRSQKEYQSFYSEYYHNTLFNISIDYLGINKNKKAEEYMQLGMEEVLKINDSISYFEFYSTLGEINYRQKNYQKAIKILSKCIPKRANYGLANVYTFRGKAYWDIGDKPMAILDFEKADSVLWAIKDFSPEILEVYATLNSYYKKAGDTEKQLAYIDKLMHVDSVLDADALYLSKEIKDQYDIPLLIAERQEIIDTLENKNANYSKWMYGLSLALGASLLWGFYYYQKRQGYKKKFEALIAAPNEETKNQITKKNSQEDLGIAPAVSTKILERLAIFEETKGYLKPNTALQTLAKSLETNSNYLSKIINVYHQKNFSSYISDLRVDYIIEELKTNPNFRKYTIKAIAEEVGFGNAESFTKAFKAKTGIYPSYYIKRLNKEA